LRLKIIANLKLNSLLYLLAQNIYVNVDVDVEAGVMDGSGGVEMRLFPAGSSSSSSSSGHQDSEESDEAPAAEGSLGVEVRGAREVVQALSRHLQLFQRGEREGGAGARGSLDALVDKVREGGRKEREGGREGGKEREREGGREGLANVEWLSNGMCNGGGVFWRWAGMYE
jgi:hypothetical protein